MSNATRQPTLISPEKAQDWSGQGQSFSVSWTKASKTGKRKVVNSADEIMLIVLDAPVNISNATTSADAAARSICILPAGTWQFDLQVGATCVVLTSIREGVQTGALNEAAYAQRDERIVPVGVAWKPVRGGSDIRIMSIDAVQASKDKPRLKMLQTSTMSINWVEYDGPRDRTALSPHSHSVFEQGSLALAGDFVHHLRVEWKENANDWIEDKHAHLGSPSLLVVPVQTIHTSEGVGEGHHILIDVFSPPRADFISKGWVANSGDYAAPAP